MMTLIRGGTYSYLTNSVHWEKVTQQTLPASLHLNTKPVFFGVAVASSTPTRLIVR